MRSCAGRLSEKNREAVSLYYVDGLSYADIAAFLDVTEATVQGRLQRARAKLRKELKVVQERFKEAELPEDFSAEIRRLIEATAARGEEQERALRRLAEIGAPAVDPLCEALGDPRRAVRMASARVLCTIGDARALRPVLRLLYSEGSWAYWKVFSKGRVLGIPGVREALLEIVRDGTAAGQEAAIAALGHIRGDREVYDCIYEVFHSTDPRRAPARAAALGALCWAAPESAVDVLAEALRDSDLRLRSVACWIAIRDGFLPPVDALLNALSHGVTWNLVRSVVNLVLKHGEEGRKALDRVLRTGTGTQRTAAALALAKTGSEKAFEVLKQELLSERQGRGWKRVVPRAVGLSYPERLAEWIEAEWSSVAGVPAVVWALSRTRTEKAGAIAERLFRDGTPAVRAAAVRILARQKGTEFLPELRRCLSEGRPRKVAQEAFWQVYRLRDAAMPAVEEMLGSENWTERKAAVCLLRRWGKLTPEQKAQAENDSHVAVRTASDWHPDDPRGR